MDESPSPKIVILTQDFSISGGLNVLSRQIYEYTKHHFATEPKLISLATSSRDTNSIRLLSPTSWFKGVDVEKRKLGSVNYIHVGSVLAEVELFRYSRRARLDRELEGATLAILVVGTPAWAHVLSKIQVPTVVLTASLARLERTSVAASSRGLLRLYRIVMALLVSRLDETAILRNKYFGVLNTTTLAKVKELAPIDSIISLTPPGVDCQKFSAARSCLSTARDKRYILSVGRFDEPRKNALLALDVYKAVVDSVREPPSLVLAGARSPTEAFWRHAEHLGVKDRIEFVPCPEEADLIKLYQQAICLLVTSNEEGFCIPIIESMACGVPAVSTSCGGPTDIIESGVDGYLTQLNDRNGLVESLLTLITYPEIRKALGERARTKIERRYDLDVTRVRCLELMTAALTGRCST